MSHSSATAEAVASATTASARLGVRCSGQNGSDGNDTEDFDF
jgi:hypothetical protein